jgi:hypothetical protein
MGISFLGFGEETDPAMAALAKKGGTIEFGHMASRSNVQFLAIITSWQDSFANNLAKENLHGRQDFAISYQNTTRQISLGFKVLATSEQEALTNLERINLLSKMMYGTYHVPEGGDSYSLAVAPYVQVRWANLVRDATKNTSIKYSGANRFEGGLMCTIDSLNYTFDGDAIGFMEEGRYGSQQQDRGTYTEVQKTVIDGAGWNGASTRGLTSGQRSIGRAAGAFLPKAINVSMTLTVNHVHRLGWYKDGQWMGPKSFPYGLLSSSDTNTVEPVLGEMVSTQQDIEEQIAEENNLPDDPDITGEQ